MAQPKDFFCPACKYMGRLDKHRPGLPELCTGCAGKIRAADRRHSNPAAIRRDMIASGIPMNMGDGLNVSSIEVWLRDEAVEMDLFEDLGIQSEAGDDTAELVAVPLQIT